jgi:hypothetical protein
VENPYQRLVRGQLLERLVNGDRQHRYFGRDVHPAPIYAAECQTGIARCTRSIHAETRAMIGFSAVVLNRALLASGRPIRIKQTTLYYLEQTSLVSQLQKFRK